MFLRIFGAWRRRALAFLAVTGMLLQAQAWALTITINSPAENASVTPGQAHVNYSVTVSGSVAGIKHISITGLDGAVVHSPSPFSDYPVSPPTLSSTLNDTNTCYVDIPANQPAGSATFITVQVEDYVDGIISATRHVTVAGAGDTTAPTFAGIQTATRLSGNVSADLAWNVATDGVTSAANMKYEIFYDAVQANVFTSGVKQTVTGVLTANVAGLTAGSSYYFGVRAKDQAGNSDANSVTILNDPLPTGPVTLPTPLIDLKPDALTPGTLSAWSNDGSLGGVFNSITEFKFTGNPVVETVSGKKAVTFNSNGMRATVSPPPSITGATPTNTVVMLFYNPDYTAGAGNAEVAFEWGTRAAGQWAGFGIGNIGYGAASYFTGRDLSYGGVATSLTGAWHLSVITTDGATGVLTAYVDNVQANTFTITATPKFNVVGIPFIMGGTSDAATNRNATASFARVQVYDSLFDAGQRTEVYNRVFLGILPVAAADNWALYQ